MWINIYKSVNISFKIFKGIQKNYVSSIQLSIVTGLLTPRESAFHQKDVTLYVPLPEMLLLSLLTSP